MRKISALIVAVVAVFALAGHAKAAPMYYQFDGTASSITDDAGIIADAFGVAFGVGSAVTYTFIVDFNADGTQTLNDGTVNTIADTAEKDFFYADYVSGDALWQKDGGTFNDPDDVAEYNNGLNSLLGTEGSLYGNSADDYLKIYSPFNFVPDWAIGDIARGFNRLADSTGAFSLLYSNLTLTSITPTSVPEPSTLLLLGSGLAGLAFVRRRFKA
ncbi:MAG: PEP-CTERM sorting domain-containing protein [Thermodesulfobacteriota bacterium]